MTTEQMILERLDSIENLIRKLVSPQPQTLLTENDFTRAKRAALEDREKKQLRRQQKMARA